MFKYTFRFNKKVFYVHPDWYAVTVMSKQDVKDFFVQFFVQSHMNTDLDTGYWFT